MKDFFGKINRKDVYHIPLVTVFLYLCSFSYESGMSSYYKIPASVISIGITNTISNITIISLFFTPIVLAGHISKNIIKNKNLSFLCFLFTCLIYLVFLFKKSDFSIPGILVMALIFFSTSTIILDKLLNKSSYKGAGDIGILFCFLISSLFMCALIGRCGAYDAKLSNIQINNINYKLITVYGDNVFVQKTSKDKKTIWLRAENINGANLN